MCEEVGRPEGFQFQEIQKHCNHSDISVTQNYAKDKTEEQKLTMFGFDPEANNL
jgi:hypothetical protein